MTAIPARDPEEDTLLPVATAAQVRRAGAALVRADRAAFAVSLGLNLTAAAAGLVAPLVVAAIIATVQAPDQPSASRLATVDRLGLLLVLAALGQLVLTRFARLVGYRFGERTSARLREQLVDRLLRLDGRTVESVRPGELASRGSVDVGAVAAALRSAIPDLVFAGLQALIIVIAVVWLSPLLGVVALIVLLVITLAVRRYLRHARSVYLDQSAAAAATATVLTETTTHGRTVDLLDLGAVRRGAMSDALARAYATQRRTLALRSRLFPTIDGATGLALAVVVAVGGALVLDGRIALGVVVAVALYLQQLSGPIVTLTIWTETLQSAAASYARVEGLADERHAVVHTAAVPADETLVLDRVDYAYGDGPDVLHQVCLTVRPGERVAVVGATGAGKTTLGRLLAGIDGPRSGSATIGGVAVAALPPEVLRRHVVMVTQDQHVFADTLRTNLVIAAPDATDDELHAALRTVEADWVAELPDGLETRLTGGRRLDGGQAQQVALARVVLADPHTVVLDEATAMLDPRSARSTERSLAAVLTGRAVVAIAHRLQTARDADRVVVMDAGRVIETGTHEELLVRDGAYARLWRGWSGGSGQ